MAKMEQNNKAHPFAADRAEFSILGRRVVDLLAEYLNRLPGEPVDRIVPQEIRRQLIDMPLPEQGQSADEIIGILADKIMPYPLATGHRRSYGWVNSPPAPIAILADAVSVTMDSGLDGYDHSAIFLMASLGRWMMELVGFPTQGSLCLLLSGGSAATLNALTAARFRAAKEDGWNMRKEGLQGGRKRMVLYASAQSHSSIQKCVEQLGIGTDNMRPIETDSMFRMRPDALARAIEVDLAAGNRPFAIAAAGGATNVGAIDPLDDISTIAERFGLWLHVDGAYGAFAALDPDYASRFRAFSRVDSVTLNPHKWLQVPVDCGALLTRHRNIHREAFSLVPDYLEEGGSEAPWPYEHMFQLTYANRALKTWAAIARLGREGVRELVVRCNRLAALLGERVAASPDLQLLAPVSLSVVNFRYAPSDAKMADAEIDGLNEAISDAISASGEAHIPTTRVGGRISLRACFLHYDNDRGDVDHLIDLVRRHGAQLAKNGG
jgi:glutamate/tyrosine decarboxylase-like PLP-dependent enzyme